MTSHPTLAAGRWQTLSLSEQLGNIGSEVSRARRWQGVDATRFEGAVARANELFDLTLDDPRWQRGRKELTQVRDCFLDALEGAAKYHTTLDDLQHYCDPFALRARSI